MGTINDASAPYCKAFEATEQPFLRYYCGPLDGGSGPVDLTRGEFWQLALRAGRVLSELGLEVGERFVLCFGENSPIDLAFRLGATLTGTVPVTVNWQADSVDRILFKARRASARLVLCHSSFDRELRAELLQREPDLPIADVTDLKGVQPLDVTELLPAEKLSEASTRVVVFTSGTTADPKGVELSYGAYRANRDIFADFLELAAHRSTTIVLVNPLHHANATAMSDLALRSPDARIVLFDRYRTSFWEALAREAGTTDGLVLAPVVARHFEMLDGLERSGHPGLSTGELREALSAVTFLVGSAPVDRTTIGRFIRLVGRPPIVRFGSTELCLQALGTEAAATESTCMERFERGWSHVYDGRAMPGYYIGRPHPPHTRVAVVKSVVRDDPDFMAACAAGQPGALVVQSRAVMTGYLGESEALADVFEDDWYIGLGDVCFRLADGQGGDDFYWVSRKSGLMIRGGANYSCLQVARELSDFVGRHWVLEPDEFEIVVAGVKIDSEFEDACCVLLELISERALGLADAIRRTFVAEVAAEVSKGARPDYLVLGTIPKNFKGAVEIRKVYAAFGHLRSS